MWHHWRRPECRRLSAQAELVFVDGHPERGPFLELWQKLFPAHNVRFLAQVRTIPHHLDESPPPPPPFAPLHVKESPSIAVGAARQALVLVNVPFLWPARCREELHRRLRWLCFAN